MDVRMAAKSGSAPRRRGVWLGLFTIAGIAASLIAWAVAAPLEGAVVLQGFVKPAFNRKVVQHQEGGVVVRLGVRDGDRVDAGQILLVLAGDEVIAEERILQAQRRALQLRARRLTGELEHASPVRSAVVSEPDVVAQAESTALSLGLQALAERQVSMDARGRAYAAQKDALETKGAAEHRAGLLADDEVRSNRLLEEAGFVSRAYVTRMNRQAEDYRARLAETQAEIADVRQRMEALRAERALMVVERRRQAAVELSATASALSEVEHRLDAAVEARRRLDVRSPVAGTVVDLAVGGEGAYVAPRQPLLGVVPADEALVIEARLPPDQAPHVHDGQSVILRPVLAGGMERNSVDGWISYVSPDRLTDERSGQGYFVVRITTTRGALGAVLPGLEFAVFIRTEPRTLAEYLLAPFRQAMRRTMREP